MLRCDKPCQDRPASLHLKGPPSCQAPASHSSTPSSHCLCSLFASGSVWPGPWGQEYLQDSASSFPAQPLGAGTFSPHGRHNRCWDPASAQGTAQMHISTMGPTSCPETCSFLLTSRVRARRPSRTPESPVSSAPSKCLCVCDVPFTEVWTHPSLSLGPAPSHRGPLWPDGEGAAMHLPRGPSPCLVLPSLPWPAALARS